MSTIKVIEYNFGAIKSAPAAVIGLGLFDGVHLGHRALIREVVRLADSLSISPAIFTFHSGSAGLKPGARRIYGDDERLRLFEELGIRLVYTVDFSLISGLSAEEFVLGLLVGELNCSAAVSGFNFKFGKGAAGNSETLSRLMTSVGRFASVIDDERVDDESVSSTKIRALLSEGRCDEAVKLLGAPYFISGEVKRGRGDGRAWGFPTINTEAPEDSPLKPGVYATAVKVGDKLFGGVTNFGTCPSFGERELHAETLILDFDGDLYGRVVDVYFLGFIREENVFSSPSELRQRIELDAALAKERINKWQETGLK